MTMSVPRVIRSPGATVGGGRRTSLGKPAGIVVLTGAIYGLSAVLRRIGGASGPWLPDVPGVLWAALGPIVTTVLVWMLLAGAFWGVATYGFDAMGDPQNLLAATGWGFLGFLCSAMLTLGTEGARWLLGGPDWAATSTTIPVAVFPVLSLVGLVAFVWTLYAWIRGVQATFAVDLRCAIVTVTLPLFGWIVLLFAGAALAPGF